MQYRYFKRVCRKCQRRPEPFVMVYRIPSEPEKDIKFAEYTSTQKESKAYGKWIPSREMWSDGTFREGVRRRRWKPQPVLEDEVMLILM